MSVRVLVVDDHAVVRAGLKLLLDSAEGIQIAGESGTAGEALTAAYSLQPDVVVMDVVMPGESGIEATRRILADVPATRVLVLSQSDDPADVREAFAAGASGYVLKDATNRELIDAVRTVASGSRYVNPALGARLAALASEKKSGAEAEGLSQREREILRLLARGHTNDDIAGMHLVGSTTAWFALVTPTDPPGRRSFTSPAQEAARDDRVRDLSFGSAGGFMYRRTRRLTTMACREMVVLSRPGDREVVGLRHLLKVCSGRSA